MATSLTAGGIKLKSALRGIETVLSLLRQQRKSPLKSALRGIETCVHLISGRGTQKLKSALRGIETQELDELKKITDSVKISP